ncbi:MAG: hypothetical protein DPW11_04570, partial [bacterium]|nr:hypothetical protein [Candidatus Microgenomates bacterium CPR3]MCQ3945018.1 hypothetical protein [bacterium]
MDEPIDVTKLKYVIYARKSTDDPQRQVQSLPSQVKECKEFAKSKGLHFKESEIIRESESAKTPGIRPKFKKMLDDIVAGKYDGIIAWNPDRLARNMREGGEIIDMIDTEIMKDLKFVTHHFTPDANGKMLLGMAFVLSKQYSDKLSQDVTRGLHDKVDDLRSHIQKHGYKTDDDGRYYPDGKNYDLICDAWQMRLKGDSLQSISDYMNSQGYFRQYRTSDHKVKMDKRILSKIFRDPFYYGLLIQGNRKVDLNASSTYKPAVTEADYLRVQSKENNRLHPIEARKNFYPFRALVRCSFCDRNMVVAPSTSKSGKRYLNFRCDNTTCTRSKKSLRVIKFLDFVYNFLEQGFNFTEQDYRQYQKDMTTYLEEKHNDERIKLHSQQGLLTHIETEIKETALNVLKFDPTSTVAIVGNNKLKSLRLRQAEVEDVIGKLKESLSKNHTENLTLEEFLNLSKNAATYIKYGDEFVKDAICRLIFLNFQVDEEKVTMYQLKEPFATLLKSRSVLPSR